MKQTLTMPGYRINEYLVVLTPHEELRNRIMQVKKEFASLYDAPSAQWGKPHLALLNFTQLEMYEERIINRLKTVSMGFRPIKIELRNYGSFPSHTIFINVPTKEPVRDLLRELKTAQQLMKMDNDHKPHFIDDPYIAIARKLLPWQYEKAWLEFASRNFTGRFIAEHMLLLKRRQGDKAWQIAKRFEFLNLPVAVKQGELFA